MSDWIDESPRHSLQQLLIFNAFISNCDALGMYVFYSGFDLDKGSSAWCSLFNTFEKGTKVKQGAIVNALIASGETDFLNRAAVIDECLGIDDAEVLCVVEGLDDATISLIEAKLDPEMVMTFNKLIWGRI